jgi:hypothetical protein
VPGDVADRAQGYAADLAHALGEFVGGGENLLGLLVEQQMIVAEVRARHVPMEVLGLHVEGECIGQQPVHGLGDVAHARLREVGWRVEGC